MTPVRIPTASYRLQLGQDFTFAQAAEIVPYLAKLGISHVYLSPYLKARAGSGHGYDIVDHNALNPQIGTRAELDQLIAVLRDHGMGQIMDVVPNHMGIGDDNAWWVDVLENGPSSEYAEFFDIDWQPAREDLRNKVLLPVLGDRYGAVLEGGELQLRFDQTRGVFHVDYHEHGFPLDPCTYTQVLEHDLDGLAANLGPAHPAVNELKALVERFAQLPPRSDTEAVGRQTRRREQASCKAELAALCERDPAVAEFVAGNVTAFNGVAGAPESYDRLHNLLEAQGYRLAYWQVAADEINYRRFFDINDLAGLRVQNPAVFDATHGLILELVASGQVDGLRVDHPDGLADPAGYLQRLCDAVRMALSMDTPSTVDENRPPLYLVVEKILAAHEYLPETWPVHGTTGYDFLNSVNGLFVDPVGERGLTRVYTRFTGRRIEFDELLYERKKLTIHVQLSSELSVLTNMLNSLAQLDRRTRDFTLNGLRDALVEVVACFPVYRTYITDESLTDQDRRDVTWAVAQAKKRSPATDASIFDFIADILLKDQPPPRHAAFPLQASRFTNRLQQYTAPVTAKALEDTTFYIYNRLVSLNEVGGDPRRFGVSVAAFHYTNQERLRHWPQAMLASSTHDTKRSEDVRSRLNVLSEVPDSWRQCVSRWSRLNRRHKYTFDGLSMPSRNDEYLLYQTLLGVWPDEPLDEAGLACLRERVQSYMLKAVREAKVHTSWLNPDPEYETGVKNFVAALLSGIDGNRFLDDFLPFQRQVAWFGWLNGLAQTVLKLTAPGMPDFYQGTELWSYSLVDPDNRRPVDYRRRGALLDEITAVSAEHCVDAVHEFARTPADGRAKLHTIWKLLQLRRARPDLFAEGDYLPLAVEGARADHICAFARRDRETMIIAAVPRGFARLCASQIVLPLGSAIWVDTRVELPPAAAIWTNVLTGESVEGAGGVPAAKLFAGFPVAVLVPGGNGV